MQAQENYRDHGVSEERLAHLTREATGEESPEAGWRPIDLALDHFEETLSTDSPWPTDYSTLYWWSDRFWLLQP